MASARAEAFGGMEGFEPPAIPEEASPVGRRWQRCAQGPGSCPTPAVPAVPSLAGGCVAGREQLREDAGCLALGSRLPPSWRAGAGAAPRPGSAVRTAEPQRCPRHGTTRLCCCARGSDRALSCYPTCLSWKRDCLSEGLHIAPAGGGGEANSISPSFQELVNKPWICWVVFLCCCCCGFFNPIHTAGQETLFTWDLEVSMCILKKK